MITEINDIMRNSLSAKRVFSFLFPLSSFLVLFPRNVFPRNDSLPVRRLHSRWRAGGYQGLRHHQGS